MWSYPGRLTAAVVSVSIVTGFTGLVLVAKDVPLTPAAADACYRKGVQIKQQSVELTAPNVRRTPVTEHELNSYLTLRAAPSLPPGLSQPRVGILGAGRVTGSAIVDLDVVRRKRAPGSLMDPLNMLGGKLLVTITGVVHARDGQGRFELQEAGIAGFPVPRVLVQQLVSYYSRTPDHPNGYDLDQPFALPYRIRAIEIGDGQAVVVQ